MRLIYKILWIEDSLEFVESILDEIKDHIGKCGFVPVVDVLYSINDEKLINLNDKRYDLMLIDYQLASAGGSVIDNGKTVIQKIRDMKIYTNILFYSSNYDKIKDLVGLDGVFIRSRAILTRRKISELYGIIDFLMERGMDINVMRGIVMSEVAEIDMIIWNLIKKMDCKEEREKLYSFVKERDAEKSKGLEKQSADELWENIEKKGTRYFPTMDRCNYLFKRMLNKENHKKIHDDIVEIIRFRNILAHAREGSVEIDNRSLRKRIIEIKSSLSNLRIGLTSIC